jgi:hypothetical protein
MLSGTATLSELAKGAPAMTALDTEPLTLPNAEMIQCLCEIQVAAREALLPAALHPSNPPLVSWQIFRFPESPWGGFQLAQTRIQCRSGVRPRAFLQAAVADNAKAADALRARWGFRVGTGEIDFAVGYQEIRASVRVEDDDILEIALRDPEGLGAGDIQNIASMHLAETPRGLRLVQVDTQHNIRRAQRGEALVDAFAPAAWGDERIVPTRAVSACYAELDLTLPKLRFVCRPGVIAFSGTESLAQPAP